MTVKSEVRQRSQMVSVRLTDEERDRYTAFAREQGWSLPHFLRLAAETVLLQEAIREHDELNGGIHV